MPRNTITLYAPDGSPHICAPVDAREILASGAGYTETPPIKPEVVVEQQPEQQSIDGDVTSADEADGGGETGDESIAPRRAGRPRKVQ